MSQLRSVVAEAIGFDPDDLSPAELAGEITEALHAIQLLEVAVSRWVKRLADRAVHLTLGYSSPTSLLADQGRMSPGRARQMVSLAYSADRAPVAFEAWADGRLSTDQARHLFRAAETVPDSYRDAEQRLVDIVETLDVVDTGRAVEYWRQSVDGPGDVDLESQLARGGLTLSDLHGMTHVDGWMTGLAGQALRAVLDAHMPPPLDEDTRTPRQRRHDALEAACRDLLDNGTTPTVGGEKPHISLICDLDALRGVAGGTHETIDGDIIDITTLRAVACDASITRIVLGPDSKVLDVGRKTRVWTAAQRRAIVARDRHCQGPGCQARPSHCDIHHRHHWADGGTTTVDDGELLCRPCHIVEHLKEHRRKRRRTKG